MSEIETLLVRARAYAVQSRLSLSTVSRKLLGNGKRLNELDSGKSLRVDTLRRAHERLDELERAA
jgi:hypothetical protein